MVLEIQQSPVSPITRVKFLAVYDQHILIALDLPLSIRNIWKALLFIDDEIVDDLQVFRLGLILKIRGLVHISASIVHVYMQVAADPSAPGLRGPAKGLQ